ncbi:response regulator [Aliiroseovarius sp. KMU-50]|uniref:Response regulator n=1 Tax=Aliiroseovarius salicola TaxID=3009082 RepID=A0ABT4W2D9_9RHOB|nr:response regulator [Aliiroseovarius sp. KMU-50]MDA5094641.1 response regulator [Aliiroseovarius sp. KMU-50]
MKILAVDDDKIALQLLEEALSSCGYDDVVTCDSGAKAFELILDDLDHFDCFLFDVQMPGMSGIDLCKEVRGLHEYDEVPIIMVTAMSEKRYIDQAFAAGATDYLTKPYAVFEVGARIGLVEKLSGERRAVSESTSVIELLIKELDKATRHGLDAPIELRGVENVLNYPAFENYLTQLSRGVFHMSSMFAIKLRDAETLHACLPPLEFKEVLRRSAKVILDKLEEFDTFLTYRGDGVFVGIQPRNGAKELASLGDEINVDLQADDPMAPPELPESAILIVGEPVVAKFLARPGSLENLHSAIANVEKKAKEKKTAESANKVETFDDVWPPTRQAQDEQELRVEYDELLKAALEEYETLGEFPKSTRTVNR